MLIFENQEDLARFLDLLSERVVDMLEHKRAGKDPSQEEEILTPPEAAKLLRKSVPSLNKMVDRGVLTKHQFLGSRRVYYLRSEILDSLKKSKL